jgi:LemA protein
MPLAPIDSMLPGPVHTKGTVAQLPDTELLKSMWENIPCVWYRAVKEQETTDSNGNTNWETVLDETHASDFLLTDRTGEIRVVPSNSADFEIEPAQEWEEGDLRYTEYRIVPGNTIFLVGLLKREAGGDRIIFNEKGEYVPIVSQRPISEARASLGLNATFWIIVSLFCISAACVCLMLCLKFHNTLGFATVVGLTATSFLLIGGLRMMSHDLAAAENLLAKQEREAMETVTQGFEKLKIPWNGNWADRAAFAKAAEAGKPGEQLVDIRNMLAARVARTTSVRNRFPQFLVARTLGLKPPPVILAAGETLPGNITTIEPARPYWIWPLLFVIGGLIVAAIGLLAGFSKVKLKRLIENVPLRPTNEVAIGLTEVTGHIEQDKEIEPISGPLTKKPCVWYHYKVQQWQGSGKNRHLVTIENRTRATAFRCHDQSGSIPIAQNKSIVISGRRAKNKKGDLIYTEASLQPDDPLYIIGSAEVDPATGDSLRIEKGPSDMPFLISNLPKAIVMTREIVMAFWLLACGIAAVAAVILGVLLFDGRIAAIDQLLAAAASILTVCVMITAIMYNDLIFLKKRVAWARSNIDVALKKRRDLIPELETIAKGYMKYEHEVQPLLAKLRAAWSDKEINTTSAADSVQASQEATGSLLAVRERYPELKADTLTDGLMREIVALENEIAARRDGYNAAVERYRSRIQAVPEIVLAKLFHFQEEPYLSWKSEIRQLDRLDFSKPQRVEGETQSDKESSAP